MLTAVVLYVLLVLFDAWFTIKRLPLVGIEMELNTLTRWLIRKIGLNAGVLVGVLVPSWAILLITCHWLWLMTLMLGMRITLFAFQLKVFFDSRAKQVPPRNNGPPEGDGLLRDPHVLRALEKWSRSEASTGMQ